MIDRKFQLTDEGFSEAEEYLKSIGEWERVAIKGIGMFSTDGYSIIDEANRLWRVRAGDGQS